MLTLALLGACGRGADRSADSGKAGKPKHHRHKHEQAKADSEEDAPSSAANGKREEASSAGAAGDQAHRWGIKTSIPSTEANRPALHVPLSALLSLPEVPGVEENDAHYQGTRISSPVGPMRLHEGQVVVTEGWLHLVAAAADGDYHMQVNGSRTDGQGSMIVEIPDPEQAPAADPRLRGEMAAARGYVLNRLLAGRQPAKKGTALDAGRYVRLTGQLFYDDAHVGEPPRGRLGQTASTLWEIHPVIEIEQVPAP